MSRFFVAIDIPEKIQNEIVRIQEILKKSDLVSGTFVKPENLHLTLKFLGDIDFKVIEQIKESLKNIVFNLFKLTLSNLGVFQEDFIRIIWIGMHEKNHDLENLQKQIENNLSYLKITKKDHDFLSHLTIMRVKSVRSHEQLKQLLSEIKIKELEFEVDNFILKESKISDLGPKYQNLEVYFCS